MNIHIPRALRRLIGNEHEPAHKVASEADTMRTRERGPSNGFANYLGGARFRVTDEPVFRDNQALAQSSGEAHTLTYVVYKLNAMRSTGQLMRDLYVWDLGAPSGTLMPIAQFHYNETTNEVERV